MSAASQRIVFRGAAPSVDESAWIAPSATVIGAVTIGARVGVFYGAVVRADTSTISIGEGSNLQDGVVVHADAGFPATVGAGVSVGHRAVLHGCTVQDDCLIGMGAVVGGAERGGGRRRVDDCGRRRRAGRHPDPVRLAGRGRSRKGAAAAHRGGTVRDRQQRRAVRRSHPRARRGIGAPVRLILSGIALTGYGGLTLGAQPSKNETLQLLLTTNSNEITRLMSERLRSVHFPISDRRHPKPPLPRNSSSRSLHGVRQNPTVVDPRLRHLLPRTDGRQYHIANDGHVRNASAGWELPRTRDGQGRRDDGWAQCSGMAGVLCGKNSGNAALPC